MTHSELEQHLKRIAMDFSDQCQLTTNKPPIDLRINGKLKSDRLKFSVQQQSLQHQLYVEKSLTETQYKFESAKLLMSSGQNAIARGAFACEEAVGYVLGQLVELEMDKIFAMMQIKGVKNHVFAVIGLTEDVFEEGSNGIAETLPLAQLITKCPKALIVDLWAQGAVDNMVYPLTELVDRMNTLIAENQRVVGSTSTLDQSLKLESTFRIGRDLTLRRYGFPFFSVAAAAVAAAALFWNSSP